MHAAVPCQDRNGGAEKRNGMAKQILLVCLVVAASACATRSTGAGEIVPPERFRFDPSRHYQPVRGLDIEFHHVVPAPGVERGTHVRAMDHLGNVAPRPDTVSETHQAVVEEADSLYLDGAYDRCVDRLRPVHESEPENLFVLERLGRCMYRSPRWRTASYTVYHNLLARINAAKSEDADVAVDVWFVDAYWKVGILHFEREEWEEAIFDMTLVLPVLEAHPEAYREALVHLTEAYYESDQLPQARYFYWRTLANDPENEYVRQFEDDLF